MIALTYLHQLQNVTLELHILCLFLLHNQSFLHNLNSKSRSMKCSTTLYDFYLYSVVFASVFMRAHYDTTVTVRIASATPVDSCAVSDYLPSPRTSPNVKLWALHSLTASITRHIAHRQQCRPNLPLASKALSRTLKIVAHSTPVVCNHLLQTPLHNT